MNGHNITNESLALSMVLVLIAILWSAIGKSWRWKKILSGVFAGRSLRLIIVGYVLKYIFNVNHAVLTLLMVLSFICFNAAWNAKKRSKYIDKALSSFIAITTGAGLTLAVPFSVDRLRADAGDRLPGWWPGTPWWRRAVLQQWAAAAQQQALWPL